MSEQPTTDEATDLWLGVGAALNERVSVEGGDSAYWSRAWVPEADA